MYAKPALFFKRIKFKQANPFLAMRSIVELSKS